MDDLTGFQRDCMYAIMSQTEPHGLAVKDQLEEYYDQEINSSRLYPNLDVLVEKGHVNKEPADRRTNVYKLTDQGQQELKDRLKWEFQCVDADLESLLIS